MDLRPDVVGDFKARFFDFYDAVVSSVRLDLDANPRRCEVLLQAQDRESKSGWSNVRFSVRGVSECRFQIAKSTFEVLSGGLQLAWQEQALYLVLDAYPDDGPGLPDLRTNIAYVVGSGCEVEITLIPAVSMEH